MDGTGAFSPQTALGCPRSAWMSTWAARLLAPDSGATPASGPELRVGSPVFRSRSQPCAREKPSVTCGPRQCLDRIFCRTPAKVLETLWATPKTYSNYSGDPPKRPRGKVRSAPLRPFSVSGWTQMNTKWVPNECLLGLE